MRPLLFLPSLLLLVAGCADPINASAAQKIVVPEPPPAADWTPPKTSLPKEVVDRASFLLKHGMGDPRKGEYRSAKVFLGSLWGRDDAPTEIHGWVLPKRGTDSTWVVATNGLVYEAQSVGKPASLEADVAILESPPSAKKAFATEPGIVLGEEAVSLLLISGRVDLAEKLHRSKTPRPGHLDFLSRWFDQAVTAHMRGDDRTALRVGRAIERERPAFEKDALARNGQQYVNGPQGQPAKTDEQFPYLNVLPVLVKDAERRLANTRPPIDLEALKKEGAATQVETLVRYLDEAKARQWGQPGGVNLVEDPIVARLVEIGEPAGDALLDVIDRDDRLTRSVSFGRDFHPARNLIRTKDAAYAAFRAILEVDELPNGPDGRPTVETLRKFWLENRGKSGPDRWFDVLADDSAGYRRWSEAAGRLFDHQGVRRNGGWTTIPNGSDSAPIKAEALRGRSNPSLSDLLAKRAVELSGLGINHDWEVREGLALAVRLADWDPKAALPVLQKASRSAMQNYLSEPQTRLGQIGEPIAIAIEARARLGDQEVWPEYAEWAAKVRPLDGDDDATKVFRPVVNHPDEPALQGILRDQFLAQSSPNNLLTIAKTNPGYNWAEILAFSPLLKNADFRRAVFEVLDDKTVIGKSWIDKFGTVFVGREGSTSGMGGDQSVLKDPLRPKSSERRPHRICDNMADQLRRLKGAPDFRTYWPQREKDAAIPKLKGYIESHADELTELIGWPRNWEEPDSIRKLKAGKT